MRLWRTIASVGLIPHVSSFVRRGPPLFQPDKGRQHARQHKHTLRHDALRVGQLMSVKIMGLVFDHYQAGGTEFVLALAIADHAHDDGTHIYPSISRLAKKARQSERTVQYNLRRMEDSGWLVLENDGVGGRCETRRYHINPEWLKGCSNCTAIDDGKGAKLAWVQSLQGCKTAHEKPKRVQTGAEKGAKLLHPNRKEPSVKQPSNKSITPKGVDLLADVNPQTAADFIAQRKTMRAPLTATAVAGLRREAEKAGLSLGEALAICCERGWRGFKAEWVERERKPQTSQTSAAAGKQMQGIMALEEMKNAIRNRMAAGGDHDGAAKTGLPVLGSDTRR